MIKIPKSIASLQLQEILIEHEVPIETWENNGTKTLEHLLSDIHSGAAEIFLSEPGEAITSIERHITSVAIDIVDVRADKSVFRLREKTRRSGGDELEPRISHTVSGKIRPNESREDAAVRCLKEKFRLKIPLRFVKTRDEESPLKSIFRFCRQDADQNVCVLTKLEMDEQVAENGMESFPGLPTTRERHVYVFIVPKSLVDPARFTRRFGKKIITYDWQRYDD
ncbi:MAG: hypothetical protein QOG91_286 [Candidatus Parcubacteria bacterium]|nr:hypothetical protein [Candidatus Parcubacteria bacterium]